MKSFKEMVRENLNEGHDRYPGDDMTQKELKIAINAAKNILDMIEDGAMIMRWQISAIVKASEELASVCTSMRADEEDDEEWEDDGEEPAYAGFEYPRMYEDVKIGDKITYGIKIGGKIKLKTAKVTNVNDSGKIYLSSSAILDKSDMAPSKEKISDHHDFVKEELDFKVSVDGLPDMYVKANSPSEVKANLRKVVKKPDSIKSVDRVTRNMVRKVFRDKAAGKEEMQEGYNDPIHRKYISDAVHEYVSKDDPKHDKIVDHLHKAKNFGIKTSDSLESHAGISTGTAMRVTKAVASHLKANFGSPSKTQTQAQRVDRYLKQKWVKPR